MALTTWEKLVSDKDLISEMRLRKTPYVEKKDYTYEEVKNDLEGQGWSLETIYKDGKTGKYKKRKPFDAQFEDDVWMVLARMGFTTMNKGRKFVISWGDNPEDTQQVDVLAADNETVIIVECKSAETLGPKTFKKPIEALIGQQQGIRKELKKRFPNQKVKFIWATRNIILDANDKERLTNAGIIEWDDDTVSYYEELVNHLGTSARYQLLGNLFENQTIDNLDMDVPAVKGEMGGHEYYMFSIEPEKLLKVGYVLHRSKANSALMPTYQRVIKKNRLKQVRDFVDEGGYFPNSILISVDTGKKDCWFDPDSPKSAKNTIARAGILHLPKRYRSAYIIDGQHRLYGYSDSNHAEDNTIPVVAFLNLDRKEQLKLFMEINENQKAVPKTLRTTLESDTLWTSPSKKDQRTALMSKLAQELGENNSSPLYKRVVIGEDNQTTTMCITVNEVAAALKKSGLFSEFAKNNTITYHGSMDLDDLDKTDERVFSFLTKTLNYIYQNAEEEWNKGSAGILTMNRGVHGMIDTIGDIVIYLRDKGQIDPLHGDMKTIVNEVDFLLDPFIKWVNSLSVDGKADLRNTFGTNGGTKFWRSFEKPIHDAYPEFNPDGMAVYLENQTKKYNDDTRGMINRIETVLKDIVQSSLSNAYGASWAQAGMPKDVYSDANTEMGNRNYEAESDDQKVGLWDCVPMSDIPKIVTYQSNWSTCFEDKVTIPGEKGDKNAKTQWITKLANMKRSLDQSNSNYSVKKDDYDYVLKIYEWLCPGDEK